MWITINFVPTCNAHGYGEFGNCSTLYIFSHSTIWRGGYRIRIGKLCLLVIDNINYFGCDYICISLQVHKVWSFGVLLLEGLDGQTWKDHVHNYMLCHLLNMDGLIDPIFGNCSWWTLSYVMWVVYRGCHYVGVWSMFKGLAYGMPYTALGQNTR
jgi:hypothetical protein